MPQSLRLAVSQSHTLSTTAETLSALEKTVWEARERGVDLILFPEAYLGGYPRTCTFGAAVGARDERGRDQFLQCFNSAVDLGDTPAGAGRAWIDRTLEVPAHSNTPASATATTGASARAGVGVSAGVRGDGTREQLERIARATGVFIVTGIIERSGGTLYCAVLYICPSLGVLGKRRKVMPTGSERLIWGQGSPSTLRAVTTTIKGVKLTLAAAICWENYMPLLRQSLYAQNVNLYLAPTADARESWGALVRTVACEGRCVVLSANMCQKRGSLPGWITGKSDADGDANGNGNGDVGVRSASAVNVNGVAHPRRKSTIIDDGNEIVLPDLDSPAPSSTKPQSQSQPQSHSQPPLQNTSPSSSSSSDEFICRGGSSIISPLGDVLAGPLWEVEDGLLVQDVDFDDCIRGRLDLDVAGSYSRNDAFRLSVEGLDLNPPP